MEGKKEKLIEDSEVEQMQCERRQKKMSSESINQKNKKFIRMRQGEKR